jgi:hypothetical protein
MTKQSYDVVAVKAIVVSNLLGGQGRAWGTPDI